MKQIILRNRNAVTGLLACIIIGGLTMSFQDTPYVNQILDIRLTEDTLPERFSGTNLQRDEFDVIIRGMEKEMSRLQTEMKDLDMELVQLQVNKSLKELDVDKIMKNLEQSLQNIDMSKMMANIKLSLSETDWDKHKTEMKEVMEESMHQLKNINKEEIRRDLEAARTELAKAGKELKGINMEEIRKEARAEMEKARNEMMDTKQMINEMEKDGLIDRTKGYSIEFKNKDLYVNDVLQPQRVSDKYRKYSKGENFRFHIKK